MWTERLIGLDPTPAPPHAFALDEHELRYGCFVPGPQGFVYETSRAVAIPDVVFAQGMLGAPMHDPHQLEALLADLARAFPEPVKEASLVVPDTWLRLTFTEIAQLPRKTTARSEMLRWKLKRLVPFRVEDLRISATRVAPFPAQEEPMRVLIGFCIDLLMSQIEDAFAKAGIEIGRITNTTLAVAASLEHGMRNDDLTGLMVVHPDAYTVSVFRRGEPLLYRYKALAEGASGAAVQRDVRLTTSFLRQHFPGVPLSRVFLASPLEEEDQWSRWLGDELDVVPEPLAFEHFRIARTQVGPSWLETAPLLGAAGLEVAWA